MLVNDFLENSSIYDANKVALIFGEQRLTYGALDSKANQLAHLLQNLGFQRGSRAAILLDNSVESIISLFGILKADGIFVMLSPTIKENKLNYILDNCDAQVLITHTQKWNVVKNACAGLNKLQAIIVVEQSSQVFVDNINCIPWNDISAYPLERPHSNNIDIDLATIIYTSGSTGNPKGVMMTHHNIISAATSITTYLENTRSDIILNVLPLSFDYGLYQVLMALKIGGTLVLEKSFNYPFQIIELLRREKVTGFPIVPTVAALLLKMENLKNYTFDSIRYISNTGAAMPVAYTQGLKNIFPHAKIYLMYGLTECKRVSYLPPHELEKRPTSVGKGMPNEEVFIFNENGDKLGPGEVGELVVRGSNVMQGYWKDPITTDKFLRPGRYPGEKLLHTGDLFKMDDEGFLYFISRKDDLIKCRGERVSPKEIEDFLCTIDCVAESAVIGTPDDLLGQAIKAFIVLRNGSSITEKSIIQACTRGLESFMVPKSVVFCQSLPKSPNGKIDKKCLH